MSRMSKMTKHRVFLTVIFYLALGCNAFAVPQTPPEDSSARVLSEIQDVKAALVKQSSWRSPIVLSPIIIAVLGWAFAFYALRSSRQDRNTDRQINAQDKETDRKLMERSRQLDLYREVYPEKVKAATGLMDKAGKLYWELRATYTEAHDAVTPDHELALRLGAALRDLRLQAQACEFLLGEEISNLTGEFSAICTSTFLAEKKKFSDPIDGHGIWPHEPTFKQLTGAIRRILHLEALELLLPPQTTEPN